jgi:hypothetical protein
MERQIQPWIAGAEISVEPRRELVQVVEGRPRKTPAVRSVLNGWLAGIEHGDPIKRRKGTTSTHPSQEALSMVGETLDRSPGHLIRGGSRRFR